MTVLKCKMCGGDIELVAENTIGICGSCGTTITLPRINDEQRAEAFNRGNYFRRIGEFDKALSVYEHIVQEEPYDAEAHWCCALCRFGIEYVEDPATMEYIPTCHRASFDIFTSDIDYIAAIENADDITKRQYQKDAAKIVEVQRGILATSQNEKPFDVFICYKETDENGGRTLDSMLAQEIYYQLTDAGFRVFFSRITLENIAGSQYEPYIFAALHSAKAMVCVGTRAEYFNSVWVKNEWSRFLAIIRKDRSKVILPCYKDVNPYDLPEQLSVLQSYDMTKIGFMQDLIRGIKKIVSSDDSVSVVKESKKQDSTVVNIAPLLKRAFMFLEDGKWNEADDYCEKVLDQDPECAQAYLGKLMAELRVKNKNDLKDVNDTFDNRDNFLKACRFSEDLSNKLYNDNKLIRLRKANEHKEVIYNNADVIFKKATIREDFELAKKLFKEVEDYKDADYRVIVCEDKINGVIYQNGIVTMNSAKTEADFKHAAEIFNEIPDYRDTEVKAKLCLQKAEDARKDSVYSLAIAECNKGTEAGYNSAISYFESILDWKDSRSKIDYCNTSITDLKIAAEKAEAERLHREQERLAAKEKAKKAVKKAVIIVTPVIVAIVVILIVLFKLIIPGKYYKEANQAWKAKNYEEAYSLFAKCPGYKDTSDLIRKAKTEQAAALMKEKKYKTAYKIYEEIGDTKTVYASKYTRANEYLKSGKLEEALTLLSDILDYKDSKDKAIAAEEKLINSKFANVKIGDIIEFGSYYQDKEGEKTTPLKWIVIGKENGKILVLSKNIIDNKAFNDDGEKTWNLSSIRKWLNGDFMDCAFAVYERNLIPETKVAADVNYKYNVDSGADTTDSVFLLSYKEAKIYLSDSSLAAKGTDYAISNGLKVDEDVNGSGWWLRTIAEKASNISCIDSEGNDYNLNCNRPYGIRPAVWINVNGVKASEEETEKYNSAVSAYEHEVKLSQKTETAVNNNYKTYYYVITEESDLNVRSIPDISGQKTGQITKGSVITVDRITDGWAYVSYYTTNGDVKSGWVSTDYIAQCTGIYHSFANRYNAGPNQYLLNASAGKSSEAEAIMSDFYPYFKNVNSYEDLTDYYYIGVVKRGNTFAYVFIDEDDENRSDDSSLLFEVYPESNEVKVRYYEGSETYSVSNGNVSLVSPNTYSYY